MTSPNVPLRLEFSVEVPGPPEQVWDAIATAHGISSWMMRTDLEERAGGTVVFHMGPEVQSEGEVTGWEPPRRLVYEEPHWAALAGQDDSTVTPLVTEFLVEATSGGTCVVTVVSSAFGQGADWEREFFDEMAQGWTPMFEHLRLYLTHFPGQRATVLEASAEVHAPPATAFAQVCAAFAIDAVGQVADVRGAKGEVEHVADDRLILRLTGPVPGLLAIAAHGSGADTSRIWVTGYLFSADAPAYVDREQPGWQAWLDGLDAARGSTGGAAG
jgi:uncharacterized protein YndB with AHSA1/START domain